MLNQVVIAGEDEPEQDSPGMMGLLGSSGLQLKGELNIFYLSILNDLHKVNIQCGTKYCS